MKKHCERTYCRYCKYYFSSEDILTLCPISSFCSKNPVYSESPLRILEEYRPIQQKNKNNDCKEFEPSLCTKLFIQRMIPQWYINRKRSSDDK